ncbi:MAG: PH domain-containing protein, partial [Candidatus Gracilibacteria bacterium]|nr:PH domain-containing protein [Candidatus Gracilibacteria bacterium]
MSIKSQCTSCQKIYSVPDESIGKNAKCSGCSQVFEIQKMDEYNTTIIAEEKSTNTPIQEEKLIQSNQGNVSIRPNKWSFLIFGKGLWVFLGLCALAAVATLIQSDFYIIFMVLLVLAGISYAFSLIVFKKENYTFTSTHIKHEHGGVFSDNSVDIPVDKITQVTVHLGFIEHLVCKTGMISIKTAGSGTGKITLKSIDNPMEIYEDIQIRMQQNGFKLKKEHLVEQGRPHFLGIFGESLRGIVGNSVVLIYFIIGAISKSSDAPNYPEINGSPEVNLATGGDETFYATFFVGAVLLYFIVRFTINYLDLKQRLYQIYDGSVFYSEGFLTKNYAFLPMEKIADTENSQSFLSKIFGIHDVIISSEGSNNRVYFFNMVNGKKIMETIKYLKGNISLTPVNKQTSEG